MLLVNSFSTCVCIFHSISIDIFKHQLKAFLFTTSYWPRICGLGEFARYKCLYFYYYYYYYICWQFAVYKLGVWTTGSSFTAVEYVLVVQPVALARWTSISDSRFTKLVLLHFTVFSRLKPGFHYPSWRPKLTGDRFPLPVNTGRVDGRSFPLKS